MVPECSLLPSSTVHIKGVYKDKFDFNQKNPKYWTHITNTGKNIFN